MDEDEGEDHWCGFGVVFGVAAMRGRDGGERGVGLKMGVGALGGAEMRRRFGDYCRGTLLRLVSGLRSPNPHVTLLTSTSGY